MDNWDEQHGDEAGKGGAHTPDGIYGFFGPFRWLSNFYQAPIRWTDGRTYPTSENLFQALKWIEEHRDEFTTMSAKEAKKKGRFSPSFDPSVWDAEKETYMHGILTAKFNQNSTLAAWLIQTGERYLEETNSWGDTYWGVCNGVGKNRLGHILMQVRAELGGCSYKIPAPNNLATRLQVAAVNPTEANINAALDRSV